MVAIMASNENEENSVTMMDVLEEQEALQEDADAVLGAGDDEHCTYDKGYMARQAVYACLTCNPVGSAEERAGVCLACSLHCHSTHNLVELYTKRNFRCDCGTPKIVANPCKLLPDKAGLNIKNTYSQNFDGVYCVCHRPYPDPENSEEDEMIQCCCCEDWYHFKHLGNSSLPAGEQYAEMVCSGCVKKLPFIGNYAALAVTVVSKVELDKSVDVESEPSATTDAGATSAAASGTSEATVDEKIKSEENSIKKAAPKVGQDENGEPQNSNNGQQSLNGTSTSEVETVDKPAKQENQMEKSADGDKPVGDKKACSAEQFKSSCKDNVALFFPEDWRSQLCTCDNCISLYSKHHVSFLPIVEDTISHYEQQSRLRRRPGSARELSVERELDALNSVDRITRTEMVSEYNTLSTELRDYLRQFANSGKVVKGDDIKEFFAGLQARKKRRGSDGMPPTVCKW